MVSKVRKQVAQERDHHHHQHTSSPIMCAHASAPASAPPVKAASNHFHEHTAESGGASGGATESSRMMSSPAGRELEAFLTQTLPSTARDRRHQLAIGMLTEEMTVGTLVMTAKSSMVILGWLPSLPPAPRLPHPSSVPLSPSPLPPFSNSLPLSRCPPLQRFFILSPPLPLCLPPTLVLALLDRMEHDFIVSSGFECLVWVPVPVRMCARSMPRLL